MADILIRMEMPETCGQCPIFNYDYNICNFLSTHHHEYETSRIDGCPLHELPEHGDLIDRDALLADGWMDLHKTVVRMVGCAVHYLPLKNPTIPVIIPASKEETE